jgi:hypothetical protein
MKHSTAQAQTRQLIADMRRMVAYLRSDITHEEGRSGVSDPALPEYPALARALIARRENLESTLASLEARLASSPGLVQEGQAAPGLPPDLA